MGACERECPSRRVACSKALASDPGTRVTRAVWTQGAARSGARAMPEPGQENAERVSWRTFFPALAERLDGILKLRGYLRTRGAILRGDDLWNRTDSELAGSGLMTPFAFNLYQSTLSALPASLVLRVLAFVFPARQMTAPPVTDELLA